MLLNLAYWFYPDFVLEFSILWKILTATSDDPLHSSSGLLERPFYEDVIPWMELGFQTAKIPCWISEWIIAHMDLKCSIADHVFLEGLYFVIERYEYSFVSPSTYFIILGEFR